MKPHVTKNKNGKISAKGRKTLSMEEKTPTMPSVMYLKYLKITRKLSGSQVRIWKAHCDEPETPVCPHCGCVHIHIHGYYDRHIICAGEDNGIRRIILRTKRYKCCNCNRTFVQDCRCIGLQKHAVRTVRLDYQMAKQMLRGVSNKNIASQFGISEATVERVMHKQFNKIVKKTLNHPCPRILGIDEHSIHRGKTKGHKFAVTLADLKHHRVYEVFEGKSSAALEPQLRKIAGRNKVQVVCMDLSSPFRSLVQRLFPNAKIVADRFHVIRLVIDTFLEFCRAANPDIRWQRGITRALRTHARNLSSQQKILLQELFARTPAIKIAHQFKEELCTLLNIKQQKKEQCKEHIGKLKEMVWLMLHDAPEHFKRLGRTIRQWFEPIIRMWRFSKSNGITEGFHRKMKGIQRNAYNFRNFENYRLRVLVACSHFKEKSPSHKSWA